MGMLIGSIAAMNAISLTDLEVVLVTSKEFQNEAMYQTTMSIVKNLLKEGVISKEEYEELGTIFAEKYPNFLGGLLFNIDLIDTT